MPTHLSAKTWYFSARLPSSSELVRTSDGARKPRAQASPVVTSPGVYEPGEHGGSINTGFWWLVDVFVEGQVLATVSSAHPQLDDTASHNLPFHLQIDAGVRDQDAYSRQQWVVDAAPGRFYIFGSSVGVQVLAVDWRGETQPFALTVGETNVIAGQLQVGVAALRYCPWADGHHVPTPLGPNSALSLPSCTYRIAIPDSDPGVDWGIPIPPSARHVTIYDDTDDLWIFQIGRPSVQSFGHFPSNTSRRVPGNCGFIRPETWGTRMVLVTFEVDVA